MHILLHTNEAAVRQAAHPPKFGLLSPHWPDESEGKDTRDMCCTTEEIESLLLSLAGQVRSFMTRAEESSLSAVRAVLCLLSQREAARARHTKGVYTYIDTAEGVRELGARLCAETIVRHVSDSQVTVHSDVAARVYALVIAVCNRYGAS